MVGLPGRFLRWTWADVDCGTMGGTATSKIKFHPCPMSALVTLLTDFGLSDAYVGVMKGVMLGICPSLQCVDLTHDIPAQNVALARFQLQNAMPYFPAHTVHLAVVDPGVGTQRRAIAAQLPTGFLVGPDNGLFTNILDQSWPVTVVELTQSRYWRTPQPSSTFHGRDIFAPAAAHLASGVPLSDLGKPLAVADLHPLIGSDWSPTTGWGAIQAIDRFGNLITNIPGAAVQSSWVVCYRDQTIRSGLTYSDSPLGSVIALVGSHGWVEIAVNGGNAQATLQAQLGDPIKLESAIST